MIRVKVNVAIDRPAAEVFNFIADFENNPNWQSGMVAAEWTSEGPHRVGSTYVQRAQFLGRQIDSTFEVLEFEPGRRVKATSTAGSFPITFTRTVLPEGKGSRVEAIIEGEAVGFFKLAEPLLAAMVRRSVQGDYRNLKRILEGAEHPAGGDRRTG